MSIYAEVEGKVSRTGYSNNDFPITVRVEETAYSTANNTSTLSISCTMSTYTTSTAWTANTNSPYLELYWHNSKTNTDTQIGERVTIPVMHKGDVYSIQNNSFTVTHQADGTASGYAYATFTKPSANTNNAVPATGTVRAPASGSLALTNIPRSATLTISADGSTASISSFTVGTSAGNALQLNYTAISGLTYTTSATLNGSSISISSNKISNTSLLTALSNKTSGTLSVTLTTKSGSTTVGTSTKTCTINISSSVFAPTLSLGNITVNSNSIVNTANSNGLASVLVGGKSTAKIVATSGTPSGSATTFSTKPTISNSNTITPSSTTSTSQTFTTGTLKNSDYTLTISATITDGRGLTKTVSKTATVYAYSPPSITLKATRCNSSGTASATGTYIKVNFTTAHSSINGKNLLTKSITYTTSGGASGTITTDGQLVSGVAITDSFTVTGTVTDAYGTNTKTARAGTSAIPLSLYSNSSGSSLGVGVGTIASAGRFDVALSSYFASGLYGTFIYTGGKTGVSDGNNGSLLNSQGQLYLFGASGNEPSLAFRSSADGTNNIGYVMASTSTGNVAMNSTSGEVQLRTAGTARLTVKNNGYVIASGNLFSGGKTAYNDNHIGNELTYNGRLYMCGTATDVPGFYFDHTSTVSGATESIRQGGMWVYAKDNATYAPATNNSAVLTTNMAINATYGIFWDKCPVARSKTTNNVVFEWVNNRIKVYIDTTMVGYMTLASS